MPISDFQVRDPRIRRTRKLLQGALGILMQSKSFDEISVQDITEAATVNRATFYDHYNDKFSLLDAMVTGGFHEFLDQRELRYETGCPGALAAIIEATCDFLTQEHAVGNCRRQTAFEPLMDAAIVAAIRILLVDGLRRHEAESALDPELVAATASAAICAGVKQWLAKPDRLDVKVIVPQLLQLVLGITESGPIAAIPVVVAAGVHPS